MACSGCEASVPQVMGFPMDNDGTDNGFYYGMGDYPASYDFDDDATDPFPDTEPRWAFEQTPAPAPEEDFYSAEVVFDGVTITTTGGTCTDSGGTCVEDTPCEFTVVAEFTINYTAITDALAPTSQAGLEAILPTISFGFTPEPGATEIQDPLELESYDPGNLGDEFPLALYSWKQPARLQWTVTGTCGQTSDEVVTFSPSTNMTVTSPTLTLDPESDDPTTRNIEVEFGMRCYECGGTSAGDVKQDTKKNANVASISAVNNAQQL